jgi:aspartate racemase
VTTRGTTVPPPPLARRPSAGPCPLSFAQERLWFLEQLEPGSPLYNICRAFRLAGKLDQEMLGAALGAIVARHEALRTAFTSEDGHPLQVVNPPRPVDLTCVDLTGSGAGRESLPRALQEAARRPFDFSRDLMLRATLFQLAADEHVLLLAMHHVASDGWSLGILVEELSTRYAAAAGGRAAVLPALEIQYADFAAWQRRWLSGPALERALAYWKTQLAGLEPLELPADRARAPCQSYRGAKEQFRLSAELVSSLRLLSRQSRVTLFTTLLAAFQTLLHRYTGRTDFAIGVPMAGRAHPEVELLIGFFVNTLVLRADLSGDPPFRALLGRVQETALDAAEHQALPFEKLVAELQPKRSLGHSPLFSVMLALDNTPAHPLSLPGITVEPVEVDTGTAKCDLILSLRDEGGDLACVVEYSTDLFDAATIRRMRGHWEALLAGIAEDPGRALSALPLLTDGERRQVSLEWNGTRRDYPAARTIHELFESTAAAAPASIALALGDRTLSYGELEQQANQIAHHLRGLGVGPDVPVAICLERSFEMIAGLLGILKAGGAYVPLDPAYPRQRLLFMLDDTRAPVLLTESRLRSALPSDGLRVVLLDLDAPAIAREPATAPENRAGPEHLAYVMYTSGSTGRPKGVSVPHRSVVRLVKNTDYARLDAAQVLLQLAPLSFDASTFEIWGSLLNGARLAIYPPGNPSVAELGEALRRHEVTTLWLTAALFHHVVEEDVQSLAPVRQLLAGGDVLSVPHVKSVLRDLPGTALINGYGPTECTTFACCHRVTDAAGLGSSVPIGRPIANTRAYVLDSRGAMVPTGVPGELYIGGDGLAREYLNLPEQTAERFVPDPFADDPGARLYRTGDLVRRRPDGVIEFVGRLDHQVKIRGFRVELGEVEAALREHPALRDVAVTARPDARGEKQLVAYVTPRWAPGPPLDELRAFLAERLPDHMIPAELVELPDMPFTPSGKVDRQTLPAPGAPAHPRLASAPIAPRTPAEAALAAIWQEVLGVSPIGVTDDFFRLGGHSLLAAKMFARINSRLGTVLPLATLFRAPTIAELAALIDKPARATPSPALVGIQPSGVRPPLFAVPGVGGNVLCYEALARLVGPGQPFYGLQSRGLDGSETPFTRIEEIATAFVADVRIRQPEGPYFLVGTCMGGIVAWEMAQQLSASGQPIGLLALLETWPPPRSLRWIPIGAQGRARINFGVSRLAYYAGAVRRQRGLERLCYLGRLTAELGRRAARRDLLGGNRSEFLLQIVTQANLHAFYRYEPRAYRGAAVLVRAEARSVIGKEDRRHVWADLARGGLDLHKVEAEDSGLLLVEPHVRAVAEILRGYLTAT